MHKIIQGLYIKKIEVTLVLTQRRLIRTEIPVYQTEIPVY